MLVLATLTGPLPKAGVVVLGALIALVLNSRGARMRAAAMAGALLLSPALLLAEIWHSPQLRVVHRHPALAAAAVVVALAALVLVAFLIARHPALFAALVVIALPFRVPIQTAGTTANLLVPLYFVVGAGVLADIVKRLRGRDARADGGGPVALTLSLFVVLYALQAIYSSGFQSALQNMVFFYAPFALAFALLRELRWTPELLRRCLLIEVALAIVFALIGYVEYATKTVFLNSKLEVTNNLHTYFTVNSVFFDPDIFGRFLALVMILLAAILLYSRRPRQQVAVTAALAVLWVCLVFTVSRSSLAALLLGLAVLAAFRWRLERALVPVAVVVLIGGAAVLISPSTFGFNQGLNGASSGRAGLISGGLTLFSDRPLQGWGSGSFATQYRAHKFKSSQQLSASHTIPVTVAAEQGLIGELAYVALVLAALLTLVRGARENPARIAVAAAFIALVLHTWLYADFLEDPLTWTLLAIGVALARVQSGVVYAPVMPPSTSSAVALT